MSRSLDDDRAIGRLLALALQGIPPQRSPECHALVERYRSDAGFRVSVDGIADGLGLMVLDASDYGLVLGAQANGPFALNLGDYRRNLSVEQRVVHGLVQLAIAAWCFPTAGELDDRSGVVKTVSTHRLVEWLIGLCEMLERKHGGDDDPTSPELREAWRVVLEQPRTRQTPDGRRSPNALDGIVSKALGRLQAAGLMGRKNDADGGTWQTRYAYRVQVRELAAHRSFERVVAAARETT